MNLNKEDQDFINKLSHKMKTQDCRGTRQPYGLVIGKKERQITDYENCEYKSINWDECDYDTFENFIAAIQDYYLEDNDTHEVWEFINENCESIDDVRYHEYELSKMMSEPVSVYGYNIVETFDANKHCLGNFFLTEDAAFEYIKRNKHNLGESAFTYGVHLYRNPEMEKLYEVIHKLAEDNQS